MDERDAPAASVERLLPERLQRLRRLTGLPVAFGGVTRATATGRALVLTRLSGTAGTGLRGLAVPSGLGLGGRVLRSASPERVEHYASTTRITHDFDHVVVGQERLTSVAAVPVVVHGRVEGVLYGAVRDEHALGERTLRLTQIVADQLALDVEASLRPVAPQVDPVPDALAELARIIAETTDPALRDRLAEVHRTLVTPAAATTRDQHLAPREVEVLRLVALGATNAEVAARLGLGEETVKSYLRSAMRKLGVRNRTAAVHAARLAGML